MNKGFTRIFCFLMAFQVLFASTGFSMYEHFCKIKGVKTYSLSVPKKVCCPAKKSSTASTKKVVLKRARCCSDKIAHYKVNPNATQNVKTTFDEPAPVWLLDELISYEFPCTKEIIAFNTRHYSNPAPPLSGRGILVRIQSFII
jgi:hypothetical protein